MIPADFRYARASSPAEAVGLLAGHGPGARLLAGGHSLIPLMRLRRVSPGLIVDIGEVTELSYVRARGPGLSVGALTRYCELQADPLLAAELPVLARVAGAIADPQVRQRGTIGGAVAHAVPEGDLPVLLLALDARIVLLSPRGQRALPVADFFTGRGETAARPDEMITELEVPRRGCDGRLEKFSRRAGDWAVVSAAAVRDSAGVRVALGGMGATPLRAGATERALAAGASPAAAAQAADQGTDPPGDQHASPRYRRHLARVLAGRALAARPALS